MKRFSQAVMCAATAVLLHVACSSAPGGNNNNDNDGDSGSRFRATIDGASWSADRTVLELVGVPYTQPGLYTLTGADLGGYAVVISLHHIGSVGTYPLGVGISVPGGSGQVSDLTGGWGTSGTGDEGTVEITVLTESRIAGTFSFTADSLLDGTTGTAVVTDGEFDLVVKQPLGPVGPLPDNSGSALSGTINGEAWNAAEVASSYSFSRDSLSIVASNNTRSMSIGIMGLTGAGTYELGMGPNTSSIQLSGDGSDVAVCCWGSNFGGSGSVTVTSLTESRIQGTFTATLPSGGGAATGEIVVTGTFDNGLPSLP